MSSAKDSSENKKNNRRAYLNDFQKDEAGNYVYVGAIYQYEGSKRDLLILKLRLSVLGVLNFAVLLLSGLIQVPGMDHSIYILIPYAVSFCGSISVCWALLRLCTGGISLRAYIYQESVEKLPARCIFTACCSIATFAGELTYILTNHIDSNGNGSIFFLILQIIAIASMFLLRSHILQTKWQKHNETAAK